jgi:type III pantothenate kinase
MILTVDIGNTNIVLGGVDGEKIVFEARLKTEATKTSDQYCVDLKILLDVYKIDPAVIEGAIIASVVPQVLNSFQTAIKKLTGHTPLVVGPGLKTGLNIRLENPGQTGADLVVADVAALREHKPPLIIIDMGTATTISVLDKNGCFLGGSIGAGVRLTLKALTKNTAQLPEISISAPAKVIGTNTADCMRSGLIYGTAAMLDGLLSRIEKELGQTPTVIATGGLSKDIIPLCETDIIYNENLLLEGLRYIYEKNT